MAQMLGGEVDRRRVGRPRERAHPMIEVWSEIFFLAGLAIVEHEAEAVALVSRTLLGAVGDVASVGGIEWGCVTSGVVGGDVLGCATGDGDNPQIIIGRSRLVLVVIRRVANLFAI